MQNIQFTYLRDIRSNFMKFFKIFLLLIIISVYFTSCSYTSNQLDTTVPDYEAINETRLDSAIRQMAYLLPDSAVSELFWAKLQYASGNYSPEWTFPASNNSKTDTLLSYLAISEEHGIDPEQFDYDTLQILNKKFKEQKLSYSGIALLELKATIAFLRYSKAMCFGLYKPQDISPNYYFSTATIDSTFTIKAFEQKKLHLHHFLEQIQPRKNEYLKIQSARKSYLKLKDSVFTVIPSLKRNEIIHLGDSHQLIPFIAKRLIISGELRLNQQKPAIHMIFDKEMQLAINKFGNKNGIITGSTINNNTIKALNMTFKEYLHKMDVNLERMRWKPAKSLGKKYILVNVADMTLKAFRNDTVALKMKVCVGKAPKNKTPFLRSNIYEIILNPTWSIPSSIVVKETAIAAAKDSSYLRRHKIRVFRKGKEVHPGKEEWAKVTKNYQPYKLVQDSGSNNALGRIKFNFANKFSVYLHDTNAKGAFGRQNRAVSHGCVRVEKPLDLSYFCLPDIDKNDEIKTKKRLSMVDNIRHSILMQPLNTQITETSTAPQLPVKLKKVSLYPNIPIWINYFTCFTTESGKVVFREDIYALDHYIIEHLHRFPVVKIEGLPEL